MLNKQICIKCHQKNEKKWDEESWNEGFIDCPKEELNIKHKGKPVSKMLKPNDPMMRLLNNIFSARNTKEIPEHCKYQS